jgi:transcriptional regulator with GAF, ATPase, and Fis domain
MDRVLFSEQLGEFGSAAPEPSLQWLSIKRLAESCEGTLDIVGGSPQMRRVLETTKRFAPYREGVLVQGESGTGKELVARALHALGPVPNGPFVTFNCSNLVPSLAESQLFGHVRGAFTDARDDSLGYFRSANGGTLFLDEVGELPLELQPKLLRAVENHEVQPVGSTRSYRVEIRVIAATNRDLRTMMKEGRFRDDLYYRLNTAVVVIPPCVSAAATWPRCSATSWRASTRCSASESNSSPRPRCDCSRHTNGRAMSASSPTRSRAR